MLMLLISLQYTKHAQELRTKLFPSFKVILLQLQVQPLNVLDLIKEESVGLQPSLPIKHLSVNICSITKIYAWAYFALLQISMSNKTM